MKARTKSRKEEWLRKVILDVLVEVCNSNESIFKNHQSHHKDVNNIKLQRMKYAEKQAIDFKLTKPRSKWELIKALQEEFDKFPDDTEFTSFSAIGIGVGRSRYL